MKRRRRKRTRKMMNELNETNEEDDLKMRIANATKKMKKQIS